MDVWIQTISTKLVNNISMAAIYAISYVVQKKLDFFTADIGSLVYLAHD